MTAPAPSRRDQSKEVHRLALIDAAFGLFVERGFAATRLEDVAVRAGVAKGTVLVHFASKEALFTAVVRFHIEPALERAEAIRDEPGTSRERLERLMRFLHGNLSDPRLGAIPKLIVSEVGNFPDLARAFHEEVCARSRRVQAELLRQGIAAGEFRPVDPELHARLLVDPVLMQAIWRHSLGRYESCALDPDTYLAAHLDLFFRALAP